MLPPRTKAQWKAHAAALYARMEHMQVHVQPDWLFALCTVCGESLELHPSMVASFRYQVATHECAGPAVHVPQAPAPVTADVLF